MKLRRYVRHVSGQGKRWALKDSLLNDMADEHFEYWVAEAGQCKEYHLPRCEYRLCDPPEEWEDVTIEFCTESSGLVANKVRHGCAPSASIEIFGHNFRDHRLRKITVPIVNGLSGYAFIIERRKS